MRLMSDVPIGAMLSGGLDSSLIVALMARNMTSPVKTFSIGFAEDGKHNELDDARYVADVLGADHHELEISYSQQRIDLSELVWSLDEPIADLSALGFLALSQLASEHVTVALSGQGADELLGGYPKHLAASLVGWWNRLPGPVRSAGNTVALRAPARYQRAARTLAAKDPADRLLAMSGRVDAEMRASLLRGPLARLDGGAAKRTVAGLVQGVVDDPLPTTLYIDGQLALVDDMLHYFDRTSMAHSLEVRVPFLDHRVVELCARIPSRHKVHFLNRKAVLKYAARGLVPDRIIEKKKLGFLRGASTDWLRAQMRSHVSEYLVGPDPRYAEFLDRGSVETLISRHVDGSDTGNVHLLISILMLEVWLSTYLPRFAPKGGVEREQIRLAG
jgi:asparagine synthase (glutamine-hydrolysing)